MKSHILESFRDYFVKLPPEAQEQAKEAFRLFQIDPFYPGLHFKKVTGKKGAEYWSARVGRGYRVLATVNNGEAYWFWIGSHSAYDKLLG